MDESVKDLLLAIADRVAKARDDGQQRDGNSWQAECAYSDALWTVENAIREAVANIRMVDRTW